MTERPSLHWIDCTTVPAPPAAALRDAAERLAAGGVVGVCLGAGADRWSALDRGKAVVEALRSLLVDRHGLPPACYVEIDAESRGVPVAPFRERRFLLPHQDGGHCSFLTPSRLDCSEVRAGDRIFSSSVYWRRASHKIIQGFFVTNPGDPPGTTYYYDALALLRLAFARRHRREYPGIAELGRFALENIRCARALCPVHGSRYLTPGAFLGSPNPAHHVLPSGPRAESHFWPEQYAAIPELFDIAAHCSCGACEGPGTRALCHALEATLGLSWPEVRARFETAAVAGRHDLLLANNLTLFHAAESGRSRTLIPICIVTDACEGQDYEQWLARHWRNGAVMSDRVEQFCET